MIYICDKSLLRRSHSITSITYESNCHNILHNYLNNIEEYFIKRDVLKTNYLDQIILKAILKHKNLNLNRL